MQGDDESADIGDDPELEAIKAFLTKTNQTHFFHTPVIQARVRAMEEESEKLRQLQSEVVALFCHKFATAT